ncbi:putative histone-like transcription factor [Ordospora colligata]|uniref:Putative histone-like transcription factor n=1 Tax=Ordospora colligata OC4 TaxID=1354746 RepID=A0A0B2ULN8_9MICR|nr:putative histone-like transcription factor [Ordospora colligata OC4]KHN70184.1 putative histone-like transcription factor [Ordospora colligata OC4]TBU16728.1 putative histone-like transcription factor [Ordospora colligata]TBU17034.1 putative histone-like transcription factor [Ordospora colligata]TBU19458.1 putative histone-like transcription factor [Ordospora colligata]
MAQGKGGKADPRVMGKDEEHHKSVMKLSQIKKIMKDRTRMRISKDALVAVGACVIYLIGEITDGARNVASTDGKKKIMPKHINNAIYNDTELHFIGHDWLIKNGGMKSSIVPGEVAANSKKSSRE